MLELSKATIKDIIEAINNMKSDVWVDFSPDADKDTDFNVGDEIRSRESSNRFKLLFKATGGGNIWLNMDAGIEYTSPVGKKGLREYGQTAYADSTPGFLPYNTLLLWNYKGERLWPHLYNQSSRQVKLTPEPSYNIRQNSDIVKENPNDVIASVSISETNRYFAIPQVFLDPVCIMKYTDGSAGVPSNSGSNATGYLTISFAEELVFHKLISKAYGLNSASLSFYPSRIGEFTFNSFSFTSGYEYNIGDNVYKDAAEASLKLRLLTNQPNSGKAWATSGLNAEFLYDDLAPIL
ncbi:hypothetical protein JF110_001661 [Campylobacter jejuni]|nr:hypothetical protein [Campylobacter jejuni]